MDFILCWIVLKEFSRHWFCSISPSNAISRSTCVLNTFSPRIKPNMKFCIRARNLVIHRCEISKSVWWFNIDRCSKYLSWINAYLDHKMLIMRMSKYLTLMNLSFIIYLDISITELIFWQIKHLVIWLERVNFKSKDRCLLMPKCALWTNRSNGIMRWVWPDSKTGLTACQSGLTVILYKTLSRLWRPKIIMQLRLVFE